MQPDDPTAVADRHDTAGSAAREHLVGLYVEDHRAIAGHHVDDMDAVDTEHLIGPSAPRRARTTRTVGHSRPSGLVAWSLPILEGLEPFPPYATPSVTSTSTMLNSEEPLIRPMPDPLVRTIRGVGGAARVAPGRRLPGVPRRAVSAERGAGRDLRPVGVLRCGRQAPSRCRVGGCVGVHHRPTLRSARHRGGSPVAAGQEAAGVTISTVARRLSIVSGFFAYLQARGDITANRVPRGLPTRRGRCARPGKGESPWDWGGSVARNRPCELRRCVAKGAQSAGRRTACEKFHKLRDSRLSVPTLSM